MEEKDIFRDTPIRLLGYANEVGEAFRAIVPRTAVHLSYAVSMTYVLLDTNDKMGRELKKPWKDANERRVRAAVACADTLIWQSFASVIVPGFTINRFCFVTGALFRLVHAIPTPVARWTTTCLGLAAIPIIYKPIDAGVEYVMDHTLRRHIYATNVSPDLCEKAD